MQKEIPMCDTFLYTDMFGLRIEPELKERIKTLKAKGVNTPQLLREAIRLAVKAAESSVDKAS